MHSVEYSNSAVKALGKLDRPTPTLIISWIEKNLVNCSTPRIHGKPFTGNIKEHWRYRVGSYRLIAKINDNILTINIVNIGHRREIYDIEKEANS